MINQPHNVFTIENNSKNGFYVAAKQSVKALSVSLRLELEEKKNSIQVCSLFIDITDIDTYEYQCENVFYTHHIYMLKVSCIAPGMLDASLKVKQLLKVNAVKGRVATRGSATNGKSAEDAK